MQVVINVLQILLVNHSGMWISSESMILLKVFIKKCLRAMARCWSVRWTPSFHNTCKVSL